MSFKCNLVLALFMSHIHFVLAVCISKKDGAHAALSQTHSPKELSCLLTIHLCTNFLVSRMKKNIYAKKKTGALLVQIAPFVVQTAL